MNKVCINNPYIKDFTAEVIYMREKDGKTEAVLDNTYFYPEGGGQPCDIGTIGDSNVTYVYEEDEVIYHVLEKKVELVKDIYCHINWERRFDFMQQHCGQHILSFAFEEVINAPTASFHLGEEYVTIDITCDTLLKEDIIKIEKIANNIVFQNVPIKFHYPKFDEISNFKLSKPLTITEDIRIVEIKGFDCSACCGTHPEHTGDVGLIKIRKYEKYKDGFRIEFVCGNRALYDYTWKNEYINEISNILSSKDKEVLDNTKKAFNELNSANKQRNLFKEKLLSYEVLELLDKAETIKGVRIVKKIFIDRDFKDVTALAGKIAKSNSAIAIFGLKSDTARMVFVRTIDVDIKINEVFKEVISLINGKGGGNPQTAQGGGSDVSNLECAIDSAFLILKNRYLK